MFNTENPMVRDELWDNDDDTASYVEFFADFSSLVDASDFIDSINFATWNFEHPSVVTWNYDKNFVSVKGDFYPEEASELRWIFNDYCLSFDEED